MIIFASILAFWMIILIVYMLRRGPRKKREQGTGEGEKGEEGGVGGGGGGGEGGVGRRGEV